MFVKLCAIFTNKQASSGSPRKKGTVNVCSNITILCLEAGGCNRFNFHSLLWPVVCIQTTEQNRTTAHQQQRWRRRSKINIFDLILSFPKMRMDFWSISHKQIHTPVVDGEALRTFVFHTLNIGVWQSFSPCWMCVKNRFVLSVCVCLRSALLVFSFPFHYFD